MSALVRVELDADVAVVVIDNPPINAGSTEVRAGLMAAVEAAAANPAVKALVLIGAGSTFIAGSDIREFGKPIADPTLPTVIAAIEACEKTVVAALHGAALGGGFELALGCDARIALEGSVVGLPEVTLGIIPGAGGTQRFPRLSGVPRAITSICSGERISAANALSLGLIDKVVSAELHSEAVAFARELVGQKHRVSELAVPDAEPSAIEKASQEALRVGKNRPAVRAAIEATLASKTLSFKKALELERTSFQTLRVSREARALRHQFFAEREAAKHPFLDCATPRPVQKVAVIGAGTMGAGIAISAIDAGYDVALFESQSDALNRGVDRIDSHYSGRVKAGKAKAEEVAGKLARLRSGLEWSLVADADLVIEAVFENLEVKQDVFRRLDEVVRPGAILASNTSYTDLDAIVQATSRSKDVVGLHFFSPANIMRLLEVVRAAETSADTLATCLQVAKRLKKISVLSGNAFGFIGNRIYVAYRRQCEFLIEEGASPQQVDMALEAFGFAMGPFAVGDMSGLDIAWNMRKSLNSTRDPKARYVRIPDMLCEAGRLGQKTHAGYYAYERPGTARKIDPAVEAIIVQARTDKGVTPRVISDEEVVLRALLAMVNEAALLLAEKVAEHASDIDVVMVNGYGFPKWEGGPIFWARERGMEALSEDLDWLAEVSGPGFVRCDISPLFS